MARRIERRDHAEAHRDSFRSTTDRLLRGGKPSRRHHARDGLGTLPPARPASVTGNGASCPGRGPSRAPAVTTDSGAPGGSSHRNVASDRGVRRPRAGRRPRDSPAREAARAARCRRPSGARARRRRRARDSGSGGGVVGGDVAPRPPCRRGTRHRDDARAGMARSPGLRRRARLAAGVARPRGIARRHRRPALLPRPGRAARAGVQDEPVRTAGGVRRRPRALPPHPLRPRGCARPRDAALQPPAHQGRAALHDRRRPPAGGARVPGGVREDGRRRCRGDGARVAAPRARRTGRRVAARPRRRVRARGVPPLARRRDRPLVPRHRARRRAHGDDLAAAAAARVPPRRRTRLAARHAGRRGRARRGRARDRARGRGRFAERGRRHRAAACWRRPTTPRSSRRRASRTS